MKIIRLYGALNVIFFLCVAFILFFDHVNYDGLFCYIAIISILGLVLFLAIVYNFIYSNYNINKKCMKYSVLYKLIFMFILIGRMIWIDSNYMMILIVYIILCVCDIYLFFQIIGEVKGRDIQIKELFTRMNRSMIAEREWAYELMYRSSLVIVVYISLVEGRSSFGVVVSVAVFLFEVFIVNKIKGKLMNMYPEKIWRTRILALIMIVNVVAIILFTLSNINLIFSCALVGLNWILVFKYTMIKKIT